MDGGREQEQVHGKTEVSKLPAWRIFLGALALSTVAAASPGDRTIKQLKRDHWLAEDGAPPSIYALAQSRDGLLWVGSGLGLYRFDGLTFERVDSAVRDIRHSGQVTALAVGPDGAMWVGWRGGGLSRYSGGRMTPILMPREQGAVLGMAWTPDGSLWVASSRPDAPLLQERLGRWIEVGGEQAFAPEVVSSIAVDRTGTLWVAGWTGLRKLPAGSAKFQEVEQNANAGNQALAVDGAGRVWVRGRALRFIEPAGARAMRTVRPASGETQMLPKLAVGRMGVWASDQQTGVERLAGGKLERFSSTVGLTSDAVHALLADRDGSLWIGTASGLDRLRVAPLAPGDPEGRFAGTGLLVRIPDGAIMAAHNEGLLRIEPGGTPKLVAPLRQINSICAAPDGGVWIVYYRAVAHWVGGRLQVFARPAGNDFQTRDCVAQADGTLWVLGGSMGHGLWRVNGTSWSRVALKALDGPDRVMWSQAGRLWVGGVETVRETDGEHVTVRWSTAPIGDLATVSHDAGARLVGGRFGIARVDRGKPAFLTSERYPWLADVESIARQGEIWWILTAIGLVEVTEQDLDHAFRTPGTPLPHRSLDLRDGLPGGALVGSGQDVAVGGDGRVWIGGPDGLMAMNKGGAAASPIPISTAITRLDAPGHSWRDPVEATLATGTSRIAVHYVAGVLTRPDRVRFRYRLNGVDPQWIGTTARQAVYTNLGPGRHRFVVQATNESGRWGPPVALAFTIPPTFFQSRWFLGLCLFAGAALLVVAYLLRVRQLTARLKARAEARLGERERIARELHDTLLQGFQGLVLRFQAVAERLPAEQAERTMLDGALDRAEAVLVEGRDRVRELRRDVDVADLPEALLAAGAEGRQLSPASFDLAVEGKPVPLQPAVLEEVAAIGAEAIRNAFLHANASSIDAVLVHDPSALRLSVRDNGAGLPADVAADGRRSGHFGMVGMRERAQRVGGKLDIATRPGLGTEVALAVPAARAYEPASSTGWIASIRRQWRR